MNILLLAGTGAMGRHLVSILGRAHHRVTVTSRQKHEDDENILYLQGDASDDAFLTEILSGKIYDAIVDFLFYDVERFRSRLDLLLQHTQQYVCISSARVYAGSDVPLTESSPRLTEMVKDADYFEAREYSQSKCLLEDALLASPRRNWTIVRPYITYSETRLQLGIYELKDWFYRVQQGRAIQLAEKIADARTTLTYGYDVAQGIAALLGQPDTLGEVFHITQNHPITWRRVLEIYVEEIAQAWGISPRVQVSRHDIYSAGGMRDMQVVYDRQLNRSFCNEKINRFIDTSTFLTPEEGLRKCLRSWLSLHGNDVLHPDWWRQALIDRVTGEWAATHEFEHDVAALPLYTLVRRQRWMRCRQLLHRCKNRLKKILK